MTINFDPRKIPPGRYVLLVSYFERGVRVSRLPQPLVPPQVQVSNLPPDTAITLDVAVGDDPVVIPFAHQVVNSGPAITCPEGFACFCGSKAFILIAPDVDVQVKFLSKAQNNPGDGDAYYALIDPGGLRSTLAGFKTENRFGTTVIPPSIEVSDAVYFNQGDLQFGRKMSGRYDDALGTTAFYVTNYPSADEAALNVGKIATVAMEFSFTSSFTPDRFVKFYVYNAADNRVPNANLDGFVREVPGLCVACHSLTRYFRTVPATADTSSRFLPFDLDAFEYAQLTGFTRAEQETKFHDLNRIITAGPYTDKRSAATQSLIDTWYPTSAPPQQSSAIVPGWSVSDSCPTILTQPQVGSVYLNSLKTSCRTCHVSRDADKDWADYGLIVDASGPGCVTPPANIVYNMFYEVCEAKEMPHSRVTYTNLWVTPSRYQTLFQWFKDKRIDAADVDGKCR